METLKLILLLFGFILLAVIPAIYFLFFIITKVTIIGGLALLGVILIWIAIMLDGIE